MKTSIDSWILSLRYVVMSISFLFVLVRFIGREVCAAYNAFKHFFLVDKNKNQIKCLKTSTPKHCDQFICCLPIAHFFCFMRREII